MEPHLDVFQALSDPSRRHILFLLSKDRLTINALSDQFDMSRPAVSKHIKILCTVGFVAIEKAGRERYCSLNTKGFEELKKWLEYYETFWISKLETLGKLMDKTQKGRPKDDRKEV